MVLRHGWLVILVGWLVSTAAAIAAQPIANPSERIDVGSTVSFLPSQERGWIVAEKSSQSAALVKRGRKKDQTYVIEVAFDKFPDTSSEEGFFALVRKLRDTRLGAGTGRFVILKNKQKRSLDSGSPCVRYHTKAEDHAAVKRSRRKGFMLLEAVGFVCRHPGHADLVVMAEFSHRYYPGKVDAKFLSKANRFLAQVQFE